MPDRPELGPDDDASRPQAPPFLKLPAEWIADLERCERDYQIEYEHLERLRHDLTRSPKLRALVCGDPPGPDRAWLCFLGMSRSLLN